MLLDVQNVGADDGAKLLRQWLLDRIISRQAEWDRASFKLRPDRRWLLRHASSAEVEERALAGQRAELPPGWSWFTAVRRIGAAGLVRHLFGGPAPLAIHRSDREIERLLPRAIVAELEQADADLQRCHLERA